MTYYTVPLSKPYLSNNDYYLDFPFLWNLVANLLYILIFHQLYNSQNAINSLSVELIEFKQSCITSNDVNWPRGIFNNISDAENI